MGPAVMRSSADQPIAWRRDRKLPGGKCRHEHVAIEVAGFQVHWDAWSAYGAMSMFG